MKNAARIKRNKRVFADLGETVDKNLCHHCENLAICSFVKASRKPVLFCEEYAGNYAPEASKTEHAVEEVSDTDRNGLASYVGLCSTCENAVQCILRKQEGGVWRCNEYR